MPTFSDMTPVARDGELILYATQDRETGLLYDSVRETASEKMPLQVFFKWGNFVELTPEELEALSQ